MRMSLPRKLLAEGVYIDFRGIYITKHIKNCLRESRVGNTSKED